MEFSTKKKMNPKKRSINSSSWTWPTTNSTACSKIQMCLQAWFHLIHWGSMAFKIFRWSKIRPGILATWSLLSRITLFTNSCLMNLTRMIWVKMVSRGWEAIFFYAKVVKIWYLILRLQSQMSTASASTTTFCLLQESIINKTLVNKLFLMLIQPSQCLLWTQLKLLISTNWSLADRWTWHPNSKHWYACQTLPSMAKPDSFQLDK